MAELCTIVHNDYDKIQDIVYWFNKSWVLKFVVQLNRYTEEHGKENFHKEYGYVGKHGFAITVNRDINYYLIIEHLRRDSLGNKFSVRITDRDMYYFLFKLSKVEKWFIEENNIFAKKDGHIIIPYRNYMERLDLIFGSYIEMEPTVLRYDNGDEKIGVRFYIGSNSLDFALDLNGLFGFIYFMRNLNMYQSAQLMLNYINGMTYGTNFTNMGTSVKTGFFDKVGATKE